MGGHLRQCLGNAQISVLFLSRCLFGKRERERAIAAREDQHRLKRGKHAPMVGGLLFVVGRKLCADGIHQSEDTLCEDGTDIGDDVTRHLLNKKLDLVGKLGAILVNPCKRGDKLAFFIVFPHRLDAGGRKLLVRLDIAVNGGKLKLLVLI